MIVHTIEDVILELDKIVTDATLKGDRVGYFAALYKKVTLAVAAKIKEGYFNDNERMERLDVVFAKRYLDAFNQYKSGRPYTFSWQLAFKATAEWRPMVIHHLVAGMNAHIGLDLGIAAATIAPGDAIHGVEDDFKKINEVLNSLMEDVKRDLFDMWPLSSFIAKRRLGNLENEIAGFSMSVARDAAWKVALAYAPLKTAEEKASFIVDRDAKVAAFGKKLLNPGVFLSGLMFAFRIFETGSIADKIRKLAA